MVAAPGTTFGAFGLHLDLADGADLPSRLAYHGLSNGQRQLRRRDHCILPVGHRGRARVVGHPEDLRFVPRDRYDPLDDTDGGVGPLQRSSLLDVQFQIAVPRALLPPRLHDAVGVAADRADRIGAPHAVPDLFHVVRRNVTRDDAAAGDAAVEGDAFLRRPDDDLEWMARAHAASRQRLENADRRKRPEIAVEVAARRDRVYVGTEQDWRKGRIRSRPLREDVAGGIHPWRRPGRPHQPGDVRPAREIRLRIRDAGDRRRRNFRRRGGRTC